MTDASADKPGSRLSLPPVERIAEELERDGADHREPLDPELEATAEAFVEEILGDNAGAAAEQRRAVDEMGLDLQRQAAHQSEMLKTPLHQLAREGEDGGPVAKALGELRGRMNSLDPRHHRLEPGPLDRLRRFIPGMALACNVISSASRRPSKRSMPSLPTWKRSGPAGARQHHPE